MGFKIFEEECSGAEIASLKRIAIVGAGVGGLQTARQLVQAGIDCVIFEKAQDVGGVWRQNYADFGLQVPNQLYEFPSFPYPKDQTVDLFPSGAQVQRYIQSYAEAYGLMALIRFGTPVQSLEPLADKRGWAVRFESEGNLVLEEFDYCVTCTGMYSGHPHVPQHKGAESFKGEILHSCTFLDKDQVKGKRVVVVGGGKSAVDNAVSAAKTGASSTLLYRDAHWPVPRYLLNLIPFQWGTYSRLGHFMLHASHDMGPLATWIHAVLLPFKWIFWRIVELMFRVQFRLAGDAVPEVPIEIDLFTGGQILTYEYRNMLKAGQVRGLKGSIDHFVEDGVVLADGTQIPADVVIYGTGFGKSYALFDETTQKKLAAQRDGLYLYRNIIPPAVPDLAFIGCEVSTFNNVLTHGLQAGWLRQVLSGEMRLPKVIVMHQVVEKEQAWKRSWMPAASARASIWQLHIMTYHDNLCSDMEVSTRRKGWNFIAEIFAPYAAADYQELFATKASTPCLA
jgi:cation diffusion facilitator CzcD-associated flavoprotein CzcO